MTFVRRWMLLEMSQGKSCLSFPRCGECVFPGFISHLSQVRHSSGGLRGCIVFWPYHMAWGIFVPWPGVAPVPPAMEAWSPNHLTTREVLGMYLKMYVYGGVLYIIQEFRSWVLAASRDSFWEFCDPKGDENNGCKVCGLRRSRGAA